MESDLQQRIAWAAYRTANGKGLETPPKWARELADAALAALGLDDLDAAVERAAEAQFNAAPDRERDWADLPDDTNDEGECSRNPLRAEVREVLEAALLATGESEGSDG